MSALRPAWEATSAHGPRIEGPASADQSISAHIAPDGECALSARMRARDRAVLPLRGDGQHSVPVTSL